MNFRSVVLLSSVLWAVGCNPPNMPDTCVRDVDCGPGRLCDHSYCVLPPVLDAGKAGTDAGRELEDAGVTLSPIDAGTDAGSSCVPSQEVCNGVDDDCDGQVDEEVRVSGVPFDGGVAAADGSCVVGIGACQRTGTVACAQGQLICSVPAGSAVVELCNGVDDDCDGQVDEAGPGLCPASGQTCGAGACSCPSGQAVCGTACVTIGSSCTVGVGACARTGSNVCVSEAVSCSATPGSPSTELCNSLDDDCDGQVDEAGAGLCPAQGQLCSAGACACPQGQSVCNGVCKVLTAEVCDGLDNDCNGQVDEGVTITCLSDGDNDRYATSTATSQVCPDASRPQAGSCPSGYVSPTAALATSDCAAADATRFQMLSVRADVDGDLHCSGPIDAVCVGATPSQGTRLHTQCLAGDDCDDAAGTRYQLLSVMRDGDSDGYCTGTAFNQCTGASPQSGYRLATVCSPFGGPPPLDCNDSSRDEWTLINVRADSDGDGWCAGATIAQCGNGTPRAGYRFTTQCGGNDCRDSNPLATSSCTSTVTVSHIKACGLGIPATQGINYDWDCGAGFHARSATHVESGADAANVSLWTMGGIGFQSGTQQLTATCKVAFGEETISLLVSCEAN